MSLTFSAKNGAFENLGNQEGLKEPTYRMVQWVSRLWPSRQGARQQSGALARLQSRTDRRSAIHHRAPAHAAREDGVATSPRPPCSIAAG